MPRTRKRQSGSGSLALCITGGVRGGADCAASHIRSFVESNSHLDHVGVFLASWTDRQCTNLPKEVNRGQRQVTEAELRDLYNGTHIVSVHLADTSEYPLPGWADHVTNGTFPYPYSRGMLGGTHHMMTLWNWCANAVPDSYDAIARIRFDQCYPKQYRAEIWPPGKQSDEWHLKVTDTSKKWETPMDADTVYMSENLFHRDKEGQGTIPDDRDAIGLTAPMKAVFGNLVKEADKGVYNVSDQDYESHWGEPKFEAGLDTRDSPRSLLNPVGFWARERYPEKLLKHHILQQGYQYRFFGNGVSPYMHVPLRKEC